ncbi:hypothetical protein DJ50_3181 [Bacillus cereus ATCC 10876]|nr:hypothetical protein DJ50_3181 [Bacillus cereus ATCC 10876]SPT81059.1 Uncharacterised protein [Bacillus cereus]SUV04875.1 Uncharacterised protein [Bacillus cereus]
MVVKNNKKRYMNGEFIYLQEQLFIYLYFNIKFLEEQ